jgi:hypothetical protein
MYSLRTITGRNDERNLFLGTHYVVVHRDKNFNDFEEIFLKENEHQYNENSNVYAYVICDGGEKYIPLLSVDENYIVAQNGSTYSNLTLK